jgi:uncharacterized protein involved in exopolysaccharide biosynthesis
MIEGSRTPEPSVLDVLTPLVRRWKLTVGLPLVCAVATAAASLLMPATYTATTTFTPDNSGSAGKSSLGGLAILAGQFGVPGLAGSSSSPEFFAAVLKSRELLRATLLARFQDRQHPGVDSARTLVDLLKVEGKSDNERINNGIRLLDDLTTTHVDKRTNVVTLSFEGRPPQLAADVANQMVSLLNEFNLGTRQTQSREQRRFVGERLATVEQELHRAEDSLLLFLRQNRRYQDSPLLNFVAGRLERQVQFRQEIFTALSREYEEARIAEVRDTPVLTIIDPAVPPDKKTHPRRRLLVFLGMLIGGAVAAAFVYLREYRTAAEQLGRPDYRAFRDAWGNARKELRALLWRRRAV